MNIDEARQYIEIVMTEDFRDKTFADYIKNTLAGDFSVEIATVLSDQQSFMEAQVRKIENLKAERDRYKAVGAKLANVAFNLAQKLGYTLTSDDTDLLDQLRKEWDEAVRG